MWCFAVFVLTPIIGSLGRDLTFGSDGAVHVRQGAFYALNTDGSLKWTFAANSTILDHASGLNGTVYVVGTDGINGHIVLHALDESDGSTRWQHNSHLTGHLFKLAIHDSIVYLVIGAQIEAISTAHGASKWLRDDLWEPENIEIGPDGTVFMADQRSVYALWPDTGTVKWTQEVQDSAVNWTLATKKFAPSKDGVFVTANTQAPAMANKVDLLHLNGEDGRILWHRTGRLDLLDPSPILGRNGELYVNGMVGEFDACNLRVLDATTGALLRLLPCLSHAHTIRQKEDGTEEDIFIAFSSNGGGPSTQTSIIAYSGTYNQVLWNTSITSFYGMDSEADFGPDGTVFVFDPLPAGNETVFAIRNGHEAWRAHHVFPRGTLMADDGTTYLSVYRPEGVVAVDINGMQKWSYLLSDPVPVRSALDAQSSFVV